MRTLQTLIKKDFIESFATKKVLIMWIACLGIGLMSPVFAKLTPEVLALYAPEGIDFSVATPTSKDAWYQFFKDGPVLCVLISALCFSNSIPKEIESGSIINILTKGVSRTKFFSSKLVTAFILWIVGFTLCVLSCHFYTKILFNESVSINWWVSLIGPMCFGGLVLSLLFLFEAVSTNTLLSIGGTLCACIILLIANIFEPIQKYNPICLIQNHSDFIFKDITPQFFELQTIITLILTLFLVVTSLRHFQKIPV